jgi:hypothetical protein
MRDNLPEFFNFSFRFVQAVFFVIESMAAVTGHYILYTMLNRFNFSLVRGVFLRKSSDRKQP